MRFMDLLKETQEWKQKITLQTVANSEHIYADVDLNFETKITKDRVRCFKNTNMFTILHSIDKGNQNPPNQ